MFKNWFKRRTVAVPRISRTAEQQTTADAQTAALALYYFDGCMFCMRVRQVIRALSLNIELRDIRNGSEHYRDLLMLGGRPTVPCLRIGLPADPNPSRWMYESRDIIAYLVEQFSTAP